MEQEIKELKKQSSFQSTHNRLSAVRDLVRSTIEYINRKLDQFQEIQSSWQTEESYFDSLCSLSNVTNVESIYQSISVPKWSILIGDKSSQLSSPTSLAIQQDTDNVFVSDKKGGRIQVYSSLGEHIRLIEKFDNPLNVFHVDRAFIVGIGINAKNLMYTHSFTYPRKQFMELNLESLASRALKDCINDHTFVTSYMDSKSYIFFYASKLPGKLTIHKWINIKPVENQKKIISPTSICQDVVSKYSASAPVRIASNGIHTYLLVCKSDNLIYEFDSEDCEYIRCFCSSSLLRSPKCVCVDGRGNILVAGSEGDSTKLLCLSPDGDVIHELLIPYEDCIGIAVNSKFDVAILCNGATHGLITL